GADGQFLAVARNDGASGRVDRNNFRTLLLRVTGEFIGRESLDPHEFHPRDHEYEHEHDSHNSETRATTATASAGRSPRTTARATRTSRHRCPPREVCRDSVLAASTASRQSSDDSAAAASSSSASE